MRVQRIIDKAESLRDKLIDTRRDFYMYPELSGEEVRTSGIVAESLRACGLEVTTDVAGHGVIGLLQGDKEGSVVAWRADMDAFPEQDILDVSYKSRVEGVKHVCGHDVHTTIGLGVAEVLSSMRDEIAGQVKFIFQPAEEIGQGALGVINAGGLENPRPDAIFALHSAPFEVGMFGTIPGTALPGVTMLDIQFDAGEIDPSELEGVIRKSMDSLHALNTLRISAEPDGLANLLSSMTEPNPELERFVVIGCWPKVDQETGQPSGLQGILRVANEELRLQTGKRIARILVETLGEAGVEYVFQFPQTISLPATVNNTDLERELRSVIENIIGKENLLVIQNPFPYNSEDFSMYLQQIPGAIYWLGVANEQRGILGVPHMPDFDVDEESLLVGTKVVSNLLLTFLDRRRK